jgi:hypothetical protein
MVLAHVAQSKMARTPLKHICGMYPHYPLYPRPNRLLSLYRTWRACAADPSYSFLALHNQLSRHLGLLLITVSNVWFACGRGRTTRKDGNSKKAVGEPQTGGVSYVPVPEACRAGFKAIIPRVYPVYQALVNIVYHD